MTPITYVLNHFPQPRDRQCPQCGENAPFIGVDSTGEIHPFPCKVWECAECGTFDDADMMLSDDEITELRQLVAIDGDQLAEAAAATDGVFPGDSMLALKDGRVVSIAPKSPEELYQCEYCGGHGSVYHCGDFVDCPYCGEISPVNNHTTPEELISDIHGMARDLEEWETKYVTLLTERNQLADKVTFLNAQADVVDKSILKERAEHASEIEMRDGKIARLELAQADDHRQLNRVEADVETLRLAIQTPYLEVFGLRRMDRDSVDAPKTMADEIRRLRGELEAANATQVAPTFPIDEAAFKAHMSEIVNLSVNGNQ